MSEMLNRYEILDELGQGGFAIVHRARDTVLDRQVALKELKPFLLQDNSWVKRFRQEAQTIARLDHPHIVTIYDVIEDEGRLFIVMRLVDGPSLESHITSQGRLPWVQVFQMMSAITAGLDYAHAKNILHRDMKPANILLDPERGPMLTDFGLAKIAGQHSMSLTASGGVVGTPHYIAPEVWDGQGTTHQSDVYALGCILYEMLTSEKVFKGDTPPAIMMSHFKPPVLPATWPSDVPPGVSDVLKNALARRPRDRYGSAAEMSADLTALANIRATPEAGTQRTLTPPTPIIPIQVERPVDEFAQVEPEFIDQMTTLVPDEPAPNLTTTAQSQAPRESTQSSTGILNTSAKLETLESSIAMLPPRWHRFFKFFSLYIILIFFLAIINLLTARYPWFLWPGAILGIPLAFYFVAILFGSNREETPVIDVEKASSPSQEVRMKQAYRRSGCMWMSTALIGSVAVLLIGIGGFCAVAQNVIEGFFPELVLTQTIAEEIQIPTPNTDEPPELDLRFFGGELVLSSGAEDLLLSGSVEYNTNEMRPEVVTEGNRVIVRPIENVGLSAFVTDGLENKWDVQLGSVPMHLALDVAATTADLDFGGVSLLDLRVKQGAAGFDLYFTEPNNVRMDELNFKGGASRASLSSLANSRADEIVIEVGAGEYILDFGGELQNDIDVIIRGGFGNVTIIMPEETRAEVIVLQGNSLDVEIEGAWLTDNENRYALPADSSESEFEIIIDVEFSPGSLNLHTS